MDTLKDISKSSVFDPVTGFGGNGHGDLNCVPDGPFSNLTLHLTSTGAEDYCLSRKFDNDFFRLANRSNVEECMEFQDYTTAWPCWALKPHTAGHWGVGGTVSHSRSDTEVVHLLTGIEAERCPGKSRW